jgi:hypothetical protein
MQFIMIRKKLFFYSLAGAKGERSYVSYSFLTLALDSGWVVSVTPHNGM